MHNNFVKLTDVLSQVYNIVADFQELGVYPSVLKTMTHTSVTQTQ